MAKPISIGTKVIVNMFRCPTVSVVKASVYPSPTTRQIVALIGRPVSLYP